MKHGQIRLGVNIDHVATVRNARDTQYPDPVQAALLAELGGADGLTVHLREDRRHIKDRDVYLLKETVNVPINLEMALTDEMLGIAEKVKPAYVCIVPEKREELTTEGGLDVIRHQSQLMTAIQHLSGLGIKVSLFVDPSEDQLDAAKKVSAPFVEIHTGEYAEAETDEARSNTLARVHEAVKHGDAIGLMVNAGHGLHYQNVAAIAGIESIYELNIGHSIIARSIFDGLREAVASMKRIMMEARRSTLIGS